VEEAVNAQDTCNIVWDIDGATGGTRIARGRTGISFYTEADIDSGFFNDTYIIAVEAWATDLADTDPFLGTVPIPIIWRPTYNAKAPILAGTVDTTPRVNRHRRILS